MTLGEWLEANLSTEFTDNAGTIWDGDTLLGDLEAEYPDKLYREICVEPHGIYFTDANGYKSGAEPVYRLT